MSAVAHSGILPSMLIRYQVKPDIGNSCGIDKNSMKIVSSTWEKYFRRKW